MEEKNKTIPVDPPKDKTSPPEVKAPEKAEVPPKKADPPVGEASASTGQAPQKIQPTSVPQDTPPATPTPPIDPPNPPAGGDEAREAVEVAPPPSPKASEGQTDEVATEKVEPLPTSPHPTSPASELAGGQAEVGGGQAVIEEPTPKKAKASTGQAPVAEPVVEVEKKPEPTPTPTPTIVSPPEVSSIVQPILSFLDKLKELRGRANAVRHENMEENLNKILEYARANGKVVNDDVERLTGVADDQATNYLNLLVKEKKLVKFGKTNTTSYKPIK